MSGSSFSVATTVFVSLAICAVISYGIFYYFKQRLSLIEKSQMEQARIMQAIISRGLHAQPHHHHLSDQEQALAQAQAQQAQQAPIHSYDKEITITQNSLIEVSSESESESESESSSDSSSESSNTETEEDKWSIGDEIHQPDEYHKQFDEEFKKNILLDTNSTIDASEDASTKKIISLNLTECTNNEDNDDDNDNDNDDDDDSSSSSSEDAANEANEANEASDFDLKIGYKSNGAKSMQLNYGNMSVPALRQLAKERGLGGEEADLQKLKKKDLVQLLQ